MFHKTLTSIICFALTSVTLAQLTVNSPYSRFGIGDLNSADNATTFSMGGFGVAFSDTNNLNTTNPASYAFFSKYRPVFNVGVKYNYLQLLTATAHNEINNAYLNNLTLGLPICNRAGLVFGLHPYSNVGYTITNNTTIENIGDVQYKYEGSGGINNLFMGGAWQLIKNDSSNLSVGVNMNYLFGSIIKSRRDILPGGQGYYNTRIENTVTVSDFAFDAGLYYSTKLSKNIHFNIGIVLHTSSKLNASYNLLAVNYIQTGPYSEWVRDTLENNDSLTGYLILPLGLAYGAALDIRSKSGSEHNRRWVIGAEYRMQDWQKYKLQFDNSVQSDSMKNSYGVSLGLQFSPEYNKLNSGGAGLLKLMDYRMGFRYNNSYLQLNALQITEVGISFGMSIPLLNSGSGSLINIGAEFVQRGTTNNNLIKEQMATVFLGLSLSPNKRADRWFVKRKYQ